MPVHVQQERGSRTGEPHVGNVLRSLNSLMLTRSYVRRGARRTLRSSLGQVEKSVWKRLIGSAYTVVYLSRLFAYLRTHYSSPGTNEASSGARCGVHVRERNSRALQLQRLKSRMF